MRQLPLESCHHPPFPIQLASIELSSPPSDPVAIVLKTVSTHVSPRQFPAQSAIDEQPTLLKLTTAEVAFFSFGGVLGVVSIYFRRIDLGSQAVFYGIKWGDGPRLAGASFGRFSLGLLIFFEKCVAGINDVKAVTSRFEVDVATPSGKL